MTRWSRFTRTEQVVVITAGCFVVIAVSLGIAGVVGPGISFTLSVGAFFLLGYFRIREIKRGGRW